jgi:hypothetical protein
MKTSLIVITFLAILSATAHAGVGETVKQVEARYGKPEVEIRHGKPERVLRQSRSDGLFIS